MEIKIALASEGYCIFALWAGGIGWAVLPLPLRLHRMPYVGFFTLWCVLLPPWCKKWKQGKIRLWIKVRISTVFGTMAETGAFVPGMTGGRNFRGVKLGTIGMNWYLPACVEWGW